MSHPIYADGVACPALTDGIVLLRQLTREDAATHLAGEDDELIRWPNGGPGTLSGVQEHIQRCIDDWTRGGDTRTFGIVDVTSGTSPAPSTRT
jgi:hypothetical protein